MWTPELPVQGVPWKVNIFKADTAEEAYLGIYLYCAKKDGSSTWSTAASAKFKLQSFLRNGDPVEHHIEPYIFDTSGLGYGTPALILWKDLFEIKNNYVKNDTIELDIQIKAADPNDPNRSLLAFNPIYSSCNDNCVNVSTITISNIDNLMAVKSPQFIANTLPWELTVFQDDFDGYLKVRLLKNGDKSKHRNVLIKLISTKDRIDSDKKFPALLLRPSDDWHAEKLMQWTELMNAENGFVNNNSINIRVEIIADDLVLDAQRNLSSTLTKRTKMECPICMESMENKLVSSASCGHVFCTDCISKWLAERRVCPMCKKSAKASKLRPIFLPF